MRLDLFLIENGLVQSRAKGQNLIKEGHVFVNGNLMTKASTEVDEKDEIKIEGNDNYVSRGAYKLLGGKEYFDLDFRDKVVLDMGSSTGGFTQVVLENGAKKVYSVDVGQSQLAQVIKEDKRVISLENTDVRILTKENVGDVDMVVGDLSFVSLTKILPHIKEILGNCEMCLLFKPQFECGLSLAKKHKGIIKDEKLHVSLLESFANFLKSLGFSFDGLAPSPIKGGDGNREYLVHLNGKNKPFSIKEIVTENFKK